jgi:hypothetical protein
LSAEYSENVETSFGAIQPVEDVYRLIWTAVEPNLCTETDR